MIYDQVRARFEHEVSKVEQKLSSGGPVSENTPAPAPAPVPSSAMEAARNEFNIIWDTLQRVTSLSPEGLSWLKSHLG